ncbi:MAG: dual specificity protein phosphatase [Chlamydiae bacterium]|nr:dual specificity protein phosphatase [Chlamydiota bacterium]
MNLVTSVPTPPYKPVKAFTIHPLLDNLACRVRDVVIRLLHSCHWMISQANERVTSWWTSSSSQSPAPAARALPLFSALTEAEQGILQSYVGKLHQEVLQSQELTPARFRFGERYPDVDQIAPHIYLGRQDELRKNGGQYAYIVTACPSVINAPESTIHHIKCSLKDRPDLHPCEGGASLRVLQDLIDDGTLEDQVYPALDRALMGQGEALVHCAEGKNRSASILLAYLIKRVGVTYEQGLHFLRSKRWCVGIGNFGLNHDVVYYKTLQNYEKSLLVTRTLVIRDSFKQSAGSRIEGL